jgi:phage terminase large subunit-like protein
MIDYIKISQDYIHKVLNKTKPCGEYEYLSVKRHVDDLERDFEYYFDTEKAKLVFSFIPLLKHYKGEWAGKEFVLSDWEAFVVYCLFGWQKKNGEGRRFNYADIEVARKNGKTTFAAAIALFMLILDNEAGAEIYAAAVDKEQAKICWDAATSMGKNSPFLSQYLKFYRNSIVMEETASFCKPLSKDSKNKDGLNPHCAICDERHAWKTNEVFEVIKSGMGARKQPLILSITTAGFDKNVPYFKDLALMKQILKGYKHQDNWFIIIFEPDKGDDWREESTWKKANPNYGISVSKEYLRKELEDAINKGGTTEVNFKTKNLNVWTDASDTWISEDRVIQNNKGTAIEELEGQRAIAGLDLASHKDFNAFGLFFPDHPNKPYHVTYYIPRSAYKDEYLEFLHGGNLVITEGDSIDIDFMLQDITEKVKLYQVEKICIDPYKAYHGLVQGLKNAGLEGLLLEVNQSISYVSEPMKLIERMVINKDFDFMQNKTLIWNFRNITTYTDPNGNIRPNKRDPNMKIDGISALINIVAYWMKPSEEKVAYKQGSLRVIT